MAVEIQQKAKTVDEWLEYEAPAGFRVELVDGEFVMTPVPGYKHQKILNKLILPLAAYQMAHPDRIRAMMTPAGVPIPGGHEGREPDMALYAEDPPDPESPGAWKRVKPFLVVEVVSPKQGRRDYIDKWRSYHVAEIPEYWIVDFQRRRFLALRWATDSWEEHPVEGEGRYETPLLPGLSLEVASLWQ